MKHFCNALSVLFGIFSVFSIILMCSGCSTTSDSCLNGSCQNSSWEDSGNSSAEESFVQNDYKPPEDNIEDQFVGEDPPEETVDSYSKIETQDQALKPNDSKSRAILIQKFPCLDHGNGKGCSYNDLNGPDSGIIANKWAKMAPGTWETQPFQCPDGGIKIYRTIFFSDLCPTSFTFGPYNGWIVCLYENGSTTTSEPTSGQLWGTEGSLFYAECKGNTFSVPCPDKFKCIEKKISNN